MSEEHLPEDNNVNEEASAELNTNADELTAEVNDAVEEVQEVVEATEEVGVETSEEVDAVVEDTVETDKENSEDSGNEVVNEDLSPEEEVQEEEPKEEVSEESTIEETANEEAPIAEKVEAGGSVMASALAAAAAVPEAVKEPEPAAPVKAEPVDDGKRWYSLRVISGKERKIKERIELEIQRNNWGSVVSQILVPSEKVYKIRSGKKVILERNILPGYILVEAFHKKFSPEIVQGIANIPNVIHFLGKTKPIPMQQSEANRMLGKVDESQEVGEALIEPYIVGETVKIIDGPFNGFVGDIKEVNEEKKKLKVIVKIFGRGTEVELNFMQVEKES